MEQNQESVTTFYRNTVGYNEGKDKVYVYTESMQDWHVFSKELADLVLYKAAKAFMIGVLIGLFTGFFTARADEAAVRRVVLQEAHSLEQAAALMAIAQIESNFRPNARGKALEEGIWQLHPKYFKLADKSIKGQTKLAIKHMNYLTKHCSDVNISLAWNLGCTGARKLKQPTKFGYYKKFKKQEEKYAIQMYKMFRDKKSGLFCVGKE